MTHMTKKNLLLLVGIVLLLTVTAGLTGAYLITQTDSVKNVFTPGRVTIQVNETFANGEKSNVTIQNTGNVTARIRAKIVVTWKDADGNVYPALPAQGSDYQLTMGSGWTQKDGYWYCDATIEPNDSTPTLIQSCRAAEGRAPEGYALSVEILGEAVQNEPTTAGWQ